METIDCIMSRRSIRKFLAKDIDNEKIGMILECGMAAPSSGNLQSWKFILIKGKEKRQAVAEAAVQQYWIAQAPIVIVVCSDDAKVKSFYGIRGERLYGIQNCAAAIQNMLIAAHALGLGGAWVSAFDEKMLRRALNIPEKIRPQAILPIGYAGETPPEPLRHHIENMVDIESWGSRFDDPEVDIMENYHILFKRGIGKTKDLLQAIFNKLKGE